MESIRPSLHRFVQRAAGAFLLALGGAVAMSYAQTYTQQPRPAAPPPAQPQPQMQTTSPTQTPMETQASPPPPRPDAFRAEVAAPLRAAEELIRAGKFSEALVKIREADAIPNRTATENAQKRLRDAAAKQVQEDQKQLGQSAKAAGATSDGNALVNVGFAYVSGGQFDPGIAMMEQGIAKGGLRRPDEAKLHLGIAYLSAGRKADAVRAFRDVGGADGTADLARLWLIYAQRPSG